MNIDKFEVFESIIKVKKNLSFNLNDESFNIIGFNREILKNVLDICYSKGYDFDNKLLTLDQVNDKISKTTLEMKAFYKLPSGLYWQGLDSASNRDLLKTCRSLLEKVGKLDSLKILDDSKSTIVDKNDIQFDKGNDNSKKSIDTPIDKSVTKKMTFINAAQLILKENDNKPMSANEIWKIIDDRDLVETKGTTPWATLNATMLSYSDNTNISRKKKVKLFTIVENNPAKFKLINDDIVNIDDEIEDDFSDLEEIRPFGKFPQPFDVEGELTKAQSQSEDDVLSFNKFRATEPDERPDELMIFNSYIKNTFSQAICVLGESGAGKSTTLDNILKNSGHIYQYIIPSASTTGLLSQFSPSAGSAGGYIPSRLGQMIEKAYNNKDVNYTAVFDECHKTSIIEMINDELLQSISKNRNKGVRFISLDDDTRRLYPSAKEDNRGNVLIPDNFGFIFISSNARVISGNPDFFNRVDIIELTEDDRKLQSIEELNQKRVTSTSDKKELVNKIVSTSNNIS